MHVAAQSRLDGRRQPAGVAGQHHARTVAHEARAGAAQQREVGGEVVALVRPVKEGEQRPLAAEEGRGQAPRQRARGARRLAVVERVGQPVAVVVDRVAALPGDRREDHEDLRRGRGLDEEGRHPLAAGRAHGQQIAARAAEGRAESERAAGVEPAVERAPRAHATDTPTVGPSAGGNAERGPLAGHHRLHRRLHGQRAHGHAGAPRQRPPQWTGGVDPLGDRAHVPGPVAHAGHHDVGALRGAAAAEHPAVPRRGGDSRSTGNRGDQPRRYHVRAVDLEAGRADRRAVEAEADGVGGSGGNDRRAGALAEAQHGDHRARRGAVRRTSRARGSCGPAGAA